MRNLLNAGFSGAIMPVNPKHSEVAGQRCYPDVASFPSPPDLAVICTPPDTVPGLIAELGSRGTRGAIVITAGFREIGSEHGASLERAMLEAGRPYLMRIVGPNCVGVVSTPIKLNASFAPGNALAGGIAFVAQSGAMVTTVLDWASARGIGFSHLVSLGDMADVDFGDMLDYLTGDTATKAILLYIEAVTSPRKFMSAARAASRLKPVIAIKAGRHEAAAKAAASHTGALAGMDAVYDAAFRRAGILRVRTLDELFDAVETVAAAPEFSGEGLTVLTNGGGVGVLATDGLIDQGGTLTPLAPETVAKLDGVLPRTWSRSNPVDIIGDATGKRYGEALSILLEAPETNGVLVLNCPTAIASGIEAAQAVIGAAAGKRRCVLTNWLGSGSAADARRLFAAARIPTFETPEDAISGFMHLVQYRRGQAIIKEVPSSVATEFVPDLAKARTLVADTLAEGQEWLSQTVVHDLLRCYRIPSPRLKLVADVEEAVAAAREFAAPLALKIASPDIVHKSDVGGVALNLENADMVRQAAEAMIQRLRMSAPHVRAIGFVVQEMIRKPRAHELIVGMSDDATFGPMIMFGAGGTAVEIMRDTNQALPPLDLQLARDMMRRTRVHRLLEGYRDRPKSDLDAIALTLVKLSALVIAHPEIREIDINPLLADESGAIALDARVRVATAGEASRRPLSIKPYPAHWERRTTLPAIGTVLLRPIRPEDELLYGRLIERLTPQDVRMRFFIARPQMSHKLIARLTQIDYAREMAFVAIEETSGELIGVARFIADPDYRRAEYAVIVASDLKGRGLGWRLMQQLIEYGRHEGLGELYGDVLADNSTMLKMCQELGFKVEAADGDASIRRVTLRLTPSP